MPKRGKKYIANAESYDKVQELTLEEAVKKS